jgi:hypothetical protein
MSNAPFQSLLLDSNAAIPEPSTPTCVADEYYTCGPDGDPYWDNVLLLVPFDGDFADLSQYSRTPTATATINATEKRFGDGAGEFAATQQVTYPNDAIFNFGTANWTIECWIRPTVSDGTNRTIVQRRFSSEFTDADNTFVLYHRDNFFGFGCGHSNGNFTASLLTSGFVALNAWSHIALVRNGVNLSGYVNGIHAGTVTALGSSPVNSNSEPVRFGRNANGSGQFLGQIDDARITLGIARYAGNFRIPAEAFPDARSTAATPPIDAFYNDTLWWVRGEDELGFARFVDSSPTRALVQPVTTSGALPALNFRHKRQGKSAVEFFNTNSHLRIEGSASRDLGTDDFCFTGWVYFVVRNGQSGILVHRGPGVSAGRFDFVVTSNIATPADRLRLFINDTQVLTGATAVPSNQWVHVALTREGNTFRAFLNGALEGTGTNSSSLDNGQRYALGGDGTGGFTWQGFVDDYRLIRGHAIHTASFTPPDPPTEQFGRTILSLHSDETPPVDSACFQEKFVTLTGAATVSTDQAKFGPSSFLIPNDGTSTANGVVVTDHQDFDFGTQDFTIECWAYRLANTWEGFLFQYTHALGGLAVFVTGGAGTVSINYRSSGGSAVPATGVVFPLNQWNFVVLQRRGANFETYLNGALINTTAVPGGASATVNSNGNFFIGRTSSNSASTWNGYIDEFRITRGVARYGAVIPVTEEMPIGGADPFWSDVTLLVNGNGTANDQSTLGAVATPAGTAQISTSVVRFGSGSLQGDGNGDWYEYPYATPILSNSVYTIEWWVRFNVVTGKTHVMWSFDPVGHGCLVRSGGIEWFGEGGSTNRAFAFQPDTWYHIALVKSTGFYSIYINGVLLVVSGAANAVTSPTTIRILGPHAGFAASNDATDGYIDDFRITMGVARYPQPFDPNNLPNCDSTTAGGQVPTSGTERPTGQLVTAQQGSIGIQDPWVRLQGAQVTAAVGNVFASIFNPNRTVALTGRGMTVQLGALTRAPYPNLTVVGTSGATATVTNPFPAQVFVCVSYYPNGDIEIRYVSDGVDFRPLETGLTWIDKNAGFNIADIAAQYTMRVPTVFVNPTPLVTRTSPSDYLNLVGPLTPLGLPASMGQAVHFYYFGAGAPRTQFSVQPAPTNPRFGELFYQHRFDYRHNITVTT